MKSKTRPGANIPASAPGKKSSTQAPSKASKASKVSKVSKVSKASKVSKVSKAPEKSDPGAQARALRDRIVELVKLVAPEVRRLKAHGARLFPEGVGYWSDWPTALQDGLDLGDDGLDDFVQALSVFCESDTSSALLRVADRIRDGETLLDSDDDDDSDDDSDSD